MSGLPSRQGPPPVSPKEKGALERDALDELDAVGFREILDQDSRPTFVLDLDSDYVDYADTRDQVRPIFCNAALRLHDVLLDSVTLGEGGVAAQQSGNTSFQEFKSWVDSVSPFDDSRDVFPLTMLYHGMLWVASTIRKRWRVISGNQCYDTSHLPKGASHRNPSRSHTTVTTHSKSLVETTIPASTERTLDPTTRTRTPDVGSSTQGGTLVSSTILQTTKAISSEKNTKSSGGTSSNTTKSGASITLSGSPRYGVPDWTAAKPRGKLTEHMMFARSVNWAATPLGPMESWSVQFREIANLVMRNPHPCSLFWGEELTMLYNEAYKNEVAGNKHPELMGTGFSGPFSELWDVLNPIFSECARTGKSVRKENDRLSIERYGYLEETFFSWSFIPMYGGTDRILGFYNGPFETTYQTISSRRLQTLRQLGENVAEARSLKQFWKSVLNGLEDNHHDVPFAVLYSIGESDDLDADSSSQSSDSTISRKSCTLEGVIGLPDDHPAALQRLDLKRSREGFVPAFREAMRTREPTILLTRNGTLSEELLEGIQWRGSGDPCKEAIIVPIRPTNGESVFAFLLIGVNPRRAYDDDYKSFIHMINRQLANSLASFLLFEDEVRRSRNAAEAAALQREQLSQQLEIQASRMRRMTELSPLGMYLFSPDGVLLEANERFYEMTGWTRDDDSPYAFLDIMVDEFRPTALAMFEDLLSGITTHQQEFRLKTPKVIPVDLNGEPIEYWVLATSQPEIGPDGKIRSIMGSIADISHIKWVQGLQDRRLLEAEEMKRQQNEFIDITSHEMRNPLSAILICADDIRDSLTQHTFSNADVKVIGECIEAANNIALCVQHQKAIVDDILTVSKLDSNLLHITPLPSQPIAVVKRAMSMFKPEVQAKDIDFVFCPHRSLVDFDIDWVNLDPSRILQITVNLITNAIKFTQNCPKRVISVHLGVSVNPPELQSGGFEYVPARSQPVDITGGEDWGDGELLYIRIKVEDTGCGLSADEKRVLFERFAQASPRTHAHYGGSGLGLFISRQLAELHGGQIGVKSEAGVGSTFGFFVKARRARSAAVYPTSHGSVSVPDQPATISDEKRGLSSTAPPVPSSASQVQERSEAPDLHILIVEDNLVNQRVLSKQLQKAGCTVSTADNGLLALDHLTNTTFQTPTGSKLSVILMDLEMPEMDGLTCVARIREMENAGTLLGHVPVIAVTANVRDEQIEIALKSGMDDVVRKPFRIPELLAKIEHVLKALKDRET